MLSTRPPTTFIRPFIISLSRLTPNRRIWTSAIERCWHRLKFGDYSHPNSRDFTVPGLTGGRLDLDQAMDYLSA